MSDEKKLPEWITVKDDGNYAVNTKEGKFVLQDIEYDKIMQAKRRMTRTDGSGDTEIDGDKFQLAIISESLVEPKKGELELAKLKTSTMMRLIFAANQMYDLNSFLSK